MNAFRFRLDPVLRYRSELEKARERERADAARARTRQEDRLTALARELDAEQAGLAAAERDALDVAQIRLRQGYLGVLRRRIHDGLIELQRLATADSAAAARLLEARKERRTLERLREIRMDEWRRDARREEQKFLDEQAGVRARARAAGGDR